MLKKSLSENTGLEIVKQYQVGLAEVSLLKSMEGYKYIVEEPILPGDVYRVLLGLSDLLSGEDDVSDDDVWRAAEILGVVDVVDKYFAVIKYYLDRERGYGKLDVLFRDELVEEMRIQPGVVYIMHRDVYGQEWIPTNIELSRGEALEYVFRIARRAGRHLSAAFPLQEFRLPEGHRVLAIIGDVTRDPVANIRKFPRRPINLLDLAASRTLSPELAALLWLVVEAQGFILIIDPQGSGKTTLMASLLDIVPPDRLVVTVEETPEIRLTRRLWLPLRVREPLVLSAEASRIRIGFRKLLKAALRTRAHYIAVSEARGREIRYLFEAASLGSGSAATFHAGSITEFERRLRLLGISEDVMDLLWLVVVMRKMRNLGYRVVEVYEYCYGFNKIFEHRRREDDIVPVVYLEKTHVMSRLGMVLGIENVVGEIKKRRDIIERLVATGSRDIGELMGAVYGEGEVG